MIIKSAEFKGAFVDWKQLPGDNLPEIALVGRSNVGKSSLINKTLNRKNLAKSSSTPGKTRTINFYLINNSFNLVDLPGYGYARVSKAEQLKWGKIIEDYLKNRKQLRGVIHLLDIRHEPTENDLIMKEWLMHYEIPILLVATKADKVSRGARQKQLKTISQVLNLEKGIKPIAFSAENGEGVDEVKEAIEELMTL
jgi:GTP-binding protein